MSTLQTMGVEIHAVLLNDGELANRLRSQRMAVTVLDERKLNALQILMGLRSVILDFNPDVVHTHRIKENILGSIANLLSINAPCLRTVHGAPEHKARLSERPAKWLLMQIDRLCGRYFQQRVVAVSEDLKEYLKGSYPESKIRMVENGIDADAVRERISSVEFRADSDGATHVGIVGRLVPVKRVDLFLDIAKMLWHSRPKQEWRFHVFGDGPLREGISNMISSHELGAVTTLHGHRDDVVSCIAALDVLVICSDHEGLPMNALEALVAGTPIVAHAVGGLPNALIGGGSVRLVQSQNPAEYVSAVNEILAEDNPGTLLPCRLLASNNAEVMRAVYAELTSPDFECR